MRISWCLVLPNPWVRLVWVGRQAEGGVGPAEGVEDPAGDPLDVTGDGICDQLYGGDQETPGQEQSGGDLRSGL